MRGISGYSSKQGTRLGAYYGLSWVVQGESRMLLSAVIRAQQRSVQKGPAEAPVGIGAVVGVRGGAQ